jgi:hypothetical protein
VIGQENYGKLESEKYPRVITTFVRKTENLEFEFEFWLMLYAHRHRIILGAAGHILLTPVNQLMVMAGSTYGHCPIWISNQRTFRSLAQRAYQLL